jgi:tetraprenyl-beta-curcumene synthase
VDPCIIDDMAGQAWGRGTAAEATVALVRANARFWPTVFPEVRRELREWDRYAHAIPTPVLRSQALAKLQHERFNTEVAATLATLVPPVRRRDVTEAIVALEVLYDYLDGLGEQPVPDPLADGRQLYRALVDAVAPTGPLADYYRHRPHCDDGGYLAALVSTCRRALWSLPAAPIVAPAAQAVLARCGEAQTRTHAVARLGPGQLRAWASRQPEVGRLRWSEVAAGATASVLAAHALVALAADPATTAADAQAVAAAYLSTCALTTMLDSLMDAEADALVGGHSYHAYYASETEAAARLGVLARDAVAAVERLPRAAHHLMTVTGAVAFYLSAPEARAGRARRLTVPITRELRPLLAPPLAIFAAWRGMKRRRAPRAPAHTSPPAVAWRRACVVSRDVRARRSLASASRVRPQPAPPVTARGPR